MFDRFGEMDSYEEINELAKNLLEEGDVSNVFLLAKENGISKEIAEMFLNREVPEICDPETAALGKLEIECTELKPKELMEDWVEYIKGLCVENETVAHQVRKKGKNLKGCLAELLKYAFKNRVSVDKEIVKAAKISASRVDFGVPGMGTAKKIIRAYYLEA